MEKPGRVILVKGDGFGAQLNLRKIYYRISGVAQMAMGGQSSFRVGIGGFEFEPGTVLIKMVRVQISWNFTEGSLFFVFFFYYQGE